MKRVHGVLAGTVCCFGLLAAQVAFAQGPKTNAPAQAALRIERVALFKNGLGFFVSSGALPEKATTIALGQLPVPAYGNFWVGTSEDVKLLRLVSDLETIEERYPAQSVGQLLQANPGARVLLRTGAEGKDVVEGIVRKNAAPDPAPDAGSPYVMSTRRPGDPYGRSGFMPPGSSLVYVETSNGVVALEPGSVRRADFAGKDIAETVPVSLKRPRIRLELEKPAARGRVSVSYLARGITWCPSYQIDLSGTNALLTAQAVVINEAADLDRVALDLVTGFPNIKFGEVLSPVAMSQSLADFLNSLAAGRTEANRGGHMMMQQAMTMNAAVFDPFADSAPVPGYSTAAEGMVSEDLFLYPVTAFTLKRGETAYVPLFSASMPFRHLYTWKIGDNLDDEDRYRRERENRSDGKAEEEVWHSCRLRNTLKMPLTTAAVQFVNRGQFIGQDMCYYTAPGGETTIRINRAMNVVAEQAEYEVERKRNAAQFYGNSFDLVKVRGELKLRSRLDKSVLLEVSKELSGDVLEAAEVTQDVTTAKGLKKVNPRHVLTWEFNLKAGEEKALSYVYQVYIRN